MAHTIWYHTLLYSLPVWSRWFQTTFIIIKLSPRFTYKSRSNQQVEAARHLSHLLLSCYFVGKLQQVQGPGQVCHFFLVCTVPLLKLLPLPPTSRRHVMRPSARKSGTNREAY